jgi:predicted RNA binding protein YcfA (HicA-like mRNA interferase family)
MNPQVPNLKPREVVAAFQKAGWSVHRQRGSHLIMRKAGSLNLLVIPMHDRDVPKGTLRGIISDADLSVGEFIDLLGR